MCVCRCMFACAYVCVCVHACTQCFLCIRLYLLLMSVNSQTTRQRIVIRAYVSALTHKHGCVSMPESVGRTSEERN